MRWQSRRKDRDSAGWQRRFWEQTFDEPVELEAFLDYIHYDPVTHGYATYPHAWPASSNPFGGRCPPYDGCCQGNRPVPRDFATMEGVAGEP